MKKINDEISLILDSVVAVTARRAVEDLKDRVVIEYAVGGRGSLAVIKFDSFEDACGFKEALTDEINGNALAA